MMDSKKETPDAIADYVSENSDPTTLYLKEISKNDLLERSEELLLSQQVEAGRVAKKIKNQESLESIKEDISELSKGSAKMPGNHLLSELTLMQPDEIKKVIAMGEFAKKRLTECNLRLVVSIAKKHTSPGMPLLDLVQEGNLGLIRSIEKYNYRVGAKFATYATWWVRQAVTRSQAEQGRTIRIPVHMIEIVDKLSRVKRILNQILNRDPSVEEIAITLNVSSITITEILAATNTPISLEAPAGEEEESSMGNFIPDTASVSPESQALRKNSSEMVEKIIDTLTESEAQVIKMRFGFTSDGEVLTLEQIGSVMGLTRERIRQIETSALKKLRGSVRSSQLKDFY
jgi:RNA polymerase primary sigma factor